ncbi:serine hydroxymethyltransferase [bacterium]|nr:serine hydroxymethyltransferase [bacterium]MBU1753499.1 serine hydroxymethyltransferase [bacterium]
MDNLRNFDPDIYNAIQQEAFNESNRLVMIASENHVSRAVLEAQGCVLTNKYAEGYPHKRYYGGCEVADIVEELAIMRAKELFGCEHVNVQPHSGSQANMAVYMAMLKPGDTIMGLDLSCGGHLTHGSRVSFSGIVYNAAGYGVNKSTHVFDYDELLALAKTHKPKMIVCGASAYPRVIDFKMFRNLADEVGAYLLADIAHIAGLVAANIHPSPVDICDFVTTTTHKTLRGPRGGMIMCKEKYAAAIDKMIFPGIQGGPLMHTIAAKAVCFKEALYPGFVQYQQQVVKNARVLADELMHYGLSLVSGGTDTHLLLIDLTSQGLTGKVVEDSLGKANIIVNKNAIPYDPKGPVLTSGIRIGTPSLTTRGMKGDEMIMIGHWIEQVIADPTNEEMLVDIKHQVLALTERFPIYEWMWQEKAC